MLQQKFKEIIYSLVQQSKRHRLKAYSTYFAFLLSLLSPYGDRDGSRAKEGAKTGSGRLRSSRTIRRRSPGPSHSRDRELHGRPISQRRERGPQRAQIRRVPKVRPLTRPEARGDDRRGSRLGARLAAPETPCQTGPNRFRTRRRGRHVEASPVSSHRHHREYLRVLPRWARLGL